MSDAENNPKEMPRQLVAAGVFTTAVVVFFLLLGIRLGWAEHHGWEAAIALSTIALACITATGFIFLRHQLTESRESLKTQTTAIEAQTRWQVYQLSFTTYKLFVDCPELYPYFYRNLAAPSDTALHDRLRATAELLLDYFEGIVLSRENLADATRHVWDKYMREMYESSPVLREFWANKKERYTPALQAALVGMAARRPPSGS